MSQASDFSELDASLDELDAILSLPLADQKDGALLAALAYSLTSLSWSSLKLGGVDVNAHPIKREIERVRMYMQKVKTL